MSEFHIQTGDPDQPGWLDFAVRQHQIQPGANPYQSGQALAANSPVFVGREELIDQIGCLLTDPKSPQNVSLVGDPYSGKSSLLNQLILRLAQDSNTVCIRCDARGLDQISQQLFFERIIQVLAIGLNQPCPTQRSDFTAFTTYIRQLAQHYRFILIIDAFDVLANNPQFDKIFFDNLHSMLDEAAYRFNSFILSETHLQTLCHTGAIRGSRLWGKFTSPYTLGLLPQEALDQLSTCARTAQLTLDPETSTWLAQLAGRHPALTQMILHTSSMAELRQQPVDKSQLHQACEQIYRALWRQRNPQEQKILFAALAKQTLPQDAQVRELHQYGLLVDQKPFCPGFADWIQQTVVPAGKQPQSALQRLQRVETWMNLLERIIVRLARLRTLWRNNNHTD